MMIEEKLTAWLRRSGLQEVSLTPPPNRAWGDLSTAAALQLAKREGKNPLKVAHELAQKLREELPDYVERVLVTPPGFLNFFLATEAVAELLMAAPRPTFQLRTKGKIVFEHTSINPNKAAHIGHVRNAVLGDTLVRVLRAIGHKVEVQNYIDDTGLQVADVVFATEFLQTTPPDDRPIDEWAWDIYTAIQQALQRNEGLKHQRDEIMHLIEQRDKKWAKQADALSVQIVERHLETMARLGISYDVLVYESSILEAGLWQKTFEALKGKGVIKLEKSGPNAGAWIVPFGGTMKLENGEERSLDKILVKSNGTATYLAKDLAYHLGPAKFDKIQAPLRYHQQAQPGSQEPLWTSREGDQEAPVGGAAQAITAIDARQSYLQEVLRESLEKLGYDDLAGQAIHFSYEVVSLSAKAADLLGVTVDEGVRSVAMSGRRGIAIKANDLIDAVEKTIEERGTEKHTAELLSRAAVRYAMLKINPMTEIVFDIETATRTSGDSGVYLCYALTRARSILRSVETTPEEKQPVSARGLTLEKSEKTLMLLMLEQPAVLQRVAESLDPSDLAKYAFQLATTFTQFYEDPIVGPIVHQKDAGLRAFRLQLVQRFVEIMLETLLLLGIEAPERM